MNRFSVNTLLLFMWTVALTATFGSLFYSEILGFIPCKLCWLQRICMYPLTIIYGVSIFKRDISLIVPGAILSSIGFFLSIYHYISQKIPQSFGIINSCGDLSCTATYVNYFGFITIPFLAAVAFAILIGLHFTIWKR